jgi:colanic acid/amylovoran biosynthesis protein
MIVEIRNVNFVNKGAELMLLAIIEKLRSEYPEVILTMNSGDELYINRAKLGLYQTVRFKKYGIFANTALHYIPKRTRERLGVVLDAEIDIILDAAGFKYSEQWGSDYTIELAKEIQKWKQQGTKYIMMPQAFGPFESAEIKASFKTIVDNAELIYARESISYNYITELVGEQDHIKISPDFTNLLKGIVPPDFDTKNNKICIVPNVRMLDKTSFDNPHSYQQFMADCLKILIKAKKKPFFLIHEGDADLKLAKEIMDLVDESINIVVESDPLKIKGIIGTCDAMIGSRFHGLVNALSQGVPVIATGWSHKYKMLLQDYSTSECLLSVNSSKAEIEETLALILDDNMRKTIKQNIEKSGIVQKKLVENMWQEIYNVMNKTK